MNYLIQRLLTDDGIGFRPPLAGLKARIYYVLEGWRYDGLRGAIHEWRSFKRSSAGSGQP